MPVTLRSMEDLPELEGWLTLTEASEDILKVSRQRGHQLAQEGKLRTVMRLGRRQGHRPLYIVREAEARWLRGLMDQSEQTGTPLNRLVDEDRARPMQPDRA